MTEQDGGKFQVRKEMRRVKVFFEGKYVAAFNDCQWRPYVYPFCSPRGGSLLQEAAVDHPFHNGIFFAHRSVHISDDEPPTDFWVPAFSPLSSFCSGRIICRQREWQIISGSTIKISERSEWIDSLAAPVFSQQTEYEIRCGQSVNAMYICSTLTALRKVSLMQTKEAFLAARVAEAFTPLNGQTVIDSDGKVGEENIFDTTSHWVDFQGRLGGETFGLLVHQPLGREPIPWFVRDYGLVGLNDFRHGDALDMTEGQQYKLNSLVAAHDHDHTNPELVSLLEDHRSNH